MKFIGTLSDKTNAAVKFVGFLLLSVMTAIIVLQVFYRYVLSSSLSWSEESARYIFIWIVMLGASMGVKEGFHVSVTILKERLPGRIKGGVDMLFAFIMGIMAAAMVVYGWDIANTVAIQHSPAMRISMFWVYLSIPVSGLLIIVHLLARIVDIALAVKPSGRGGR